MNKSLDAIKSKWYYLKKKAQKLQFKMSRVLILSYIFAGYLQDF